jgi:hypothetical protein
LSRGPGSVQDWITFHLVVFPEGCTIAEMAFAFCTESGIKKSLRRSARHSLTRALRGLVKAGTVKRLLPPRQFIFCLTKPPKPDAAAQNEKLDIAYHAD